MSIDAPTEDETLLGGETGNDFDFERWSMRLGTGKYDGHLLEMSAALNQRAMDENTRRWTVDFGDRTWTEDDYPADAAEHAERYSGLGWGFITALVGQNVAANIRPARAILYGLARSEMGLPDAGARQSIQGSASELLGRFSYVEVDSPGKTEPPT